MTPTPNLSASVQAKKGRLYAVIQVKKNGKMTGVWRSLELPEGSPKTKINKAFRDVVGRYEEECAEEIERNSRPISQLPIYDYMHIYLEKARGSLQLNTIRSYQNMIEGKIKAYFSDRPELTVSTLKAADINRFYEYLFSYDVSANTVIHYHVVLHRAFKQAFKDEQIDSNPFDRIDRPKKEKFEGDHYSKEELHALLEVARDDPIYPAIILAGCMGLRRSEAIGAKWSNIDWETRHILLDSKVVEVTIDDQHMVEVVSKMKNESSHRTIVIPNEMVEALLEIKERQELNKKMFKGSYNRKNDDFICTDQFGELLRPNYVTQHYRLLLEKNGLRHIRFHDLRHTFASILLSNRTELIEVSKFLGHSTIATTANIYAHLDMSNKEHTASVMSDILAGMNTTKAPKKTGAFIYMTEEKAMAKEGYMTGNQLRQYLHISTRKLKFLMDNDYIPHENTGHPTHKYLVKIEDAEAFNKRQHTDKKLIADLAGLFTSRTEHHPLPKAEVSEETLCEYRRFVEERFRTEPEALSVTRICELTSMVGMTVHRLIASGILYGTKVQGKTFCSKSTLIDYLASEDTFRNPTCEGCKELVRTFKRRKSDDTYNEQRRERRKLEREKKGSGT